MAFGQGFTGLLVAAIVALSSGLAFILCFREFFREIFARRHPRFEKTLRRNRTILLDRSAAEFVVDDGVFANLLERRTNDASQAVREWQDPTAYLFTLGFLGLVAAAGFVAGLSHFT